MSLEDGDDEYEYVDDLLKDDVDYFYTSYVPVALNVIHSHDDDAAVAMAVVMVVAVVVLAGIRVASEYYEHDPLS